MVSAYEWVYSRHRRLFLYTQSVPTRSELEFWLFNYLVTLLPNWNAPFLVVNAKIVKNVSWSKTWWWKSMKAVNLMEFFSPLSPQFLQKCAAKFITILQRIFKKCSECEILFSSNRKFNKSIPCIPINRKWFIPPKRWTKYIWIILSSHGILKFKRIGVNQQQTAAKKIIKLI